MAILEVPADSPALVHAAADAALFLHIAGGGVGIVSGAAALLFRKGERDHRLAGNIFFVSMLIMSGVGAIVAPMLPERISSVAGFFTFYLVATAWATVKRKEGMIGRFETAAFVYAVACAAGAALLGVQAGASPGRELDGFPETFHYYVAGFIALAALMDLTVIWRGGVTGAQRIARHLWRMCFGLWIAAGSFFLGQAQIFPDFIRASNVLLVPEIAILAVLIFWLLVVAFTRRFRSSVA